METERRRRIQKPIGIYVLTILIFIRLGVFQLLNYWYEIQNSDDNLPFTIVFVSLFLTIFTAASAVWAFVGDNSGRIALLIFVSLNVLWWIFLILMAIAFSESQRLEWLRLIPSLIQPIFCLIITWWYFTKEHVVAYYKQNI